LKANSESEKLSHPSLHPLIVAHGSSDPSTYVMNIIRSIPPSELEESLLIVPFAHIISLLFYLRDWAEKGCYFELLSRVLFFILRIHQKQIITNCILRSSLESIRALLRARLRTYKVCVNFLSFSSLLFLCYSTFFSISYQDTMGFNLAAMNHLRHEIETNYELVFFDVEKVLREKQVKKKARKRKVAS
jgi:U3 small nucleolar RNA-associated protein 12